MKFAADTGALLSLCCSERFPLILEEYTLHTTKEGKEELLQFATYSDFLGQKAARVHKALLSKKIILEQPQTPISLKIDTAERAVFSLGREKKYTIITDDVHAARVAQQQINLPTKPSFYIFFLFYKEQKITKQQLLFDIECIKQQRNWLTGALYH